LLTSRAALLHRVVVSAAVVVVVVGLSFGAGSPAVAAGPTATATPNTRVTDQQVVTLTGAGFDPHVLIEVQECAGTQSAPPVSDNSCNGNTTNALGYTDGSGRYVNEPNDPSQNTSGFTVYALPDTALHPSAIKCDATHPCVLFVGEQESDWSKPHAWVGITFSSATVAAGTTPKKSSSSSPAIPIAAAVVVVALAGGVIVWRRRTVAGR
jgi:hypothetical protein